ncbi:MAG TPA: type II toxin-antitoxin system prevent-host-death family antitoxin [Candidatus Paceibacterota bacterium]
MKTLEKIIGLKDLRLNAKNYIDAASRGQSFIVVNRSQPIFKVVPVDEWGDEGIWEKIIDFTKIKKGGVPMSKVLAALRSMK